MAGATSPGSLTPCKSTQQAPSENRDATSRATSTASRVLPQPPEPVNVTTRASATRSATFALSRSLPTNAATRAGSPLCFSMDSASPRSYEHASHAPVHSRGGAKAWACRVDGHPSVEPSPMRAAYGAGNALAFLSADRTREARARKADLPPPLADECSHGCHLTWANGKSRVPTAAAQSAIKACRRGRSPHRSPHRTPHRSRYPLAHLIAPASQTSPSTEGVAGRQRERECAPLSFGSPRGHSQHLCPG